MSIFPSLQTKLEFLEDVVILSFGDPSPFTSETRNEWIRTRTQTFFPNLSPAQKDRLMLLSNTINTLGEAREERDKERQFLLQEGDLI
jgi:serine protease inhibitor